MGSSFLTFPSFPSLSHLGHPSHLGHLSRLRDWESTNKLMRIVPGHRRRKERKERLALWKDPIIHVYIYIHTYIHT